ncbi:MAG: hypothetical protein Q4D65_03290 [Peptostreptococcaceae bacterium]|nr:hypothetical protein [Peptostreptococcaceae bacterium]
MGEKSWEELIEQKRKLEEEYREKNRKLKYLKRLKKLKTFLPQLLKNIIIFVMSILLIIGIPFSLFAIFPLVILLLLVMIIDCLVVRIKKLWNEVITKCQDIYKQYKSEELESDIKELEDKEIPEIENRIDRLAPKIERKGDERLKNEWGKIKEFAFDQPALTIFILTMGFTGCAYLGKLIVYYSIRGGFDYWGIHSGNISIFGNRLDRYILSGWIVFIWIICFFIMNEWKYRYKGNEKKISIKLWYFFLVYIPACICLTSVCVLPLVLNINQGMDKFIVSAFLLLVISVFALYSIEISNLKGKRIEIIKCIGELLFWVVVISLFSFLSIKFLLGKNELGLQNLIWIIVWFLLAPVSVYFISALIIGEIIKLILYPLIDIFVTKKDILVTRTASERVKNFNTKVVFIFVMISTIFLGGYLATAFSFKFKNEYTVVQVKLPYEDTAKEYVVLLEHNNQYYISDFGIEGKVPDITLRIFNGEYYIISNENIKVRKQKSSKQIKTDMSRDKYLAMQNQTENEETKNEAEENKSNNTQQIINNYYYGIPKPPNTGKRNCD